MKKFLKKITPKFLINFYHLNLAFFGALIYRWPSRKLKIIGVTGTKGKSSCVYLIGKILEEVDPQVGWISSISIKDGKTEKPNPYNMTMPGRFAIQKNLFRIAKAGGKYAVVEVTSEGVLQHRHRFIDFDTAVFTNLAPEHIEAHGSFEEYKQAKGQFFKSLDENGQMVINLDDDHADYFLNFSAKKKIGYGLKDHQINIKQVKPERYQIKKNGLIFSLNNLEFELSLLGKFNLLNALAALAVASCYEIDLVVVKKALEKIKRINGRMEEIKQGQSFRVFVDMAHTPDSYQQVFELANDLPHQKIIAVFGATGGGRDKWKRPEMGKIAARFSDYIVITNDDPYNEDERKIAQDIAVGFNGQVNYEIIIDRRKAIKKALEIASAEDIVLVLGKGAERVIKLKEGNVSWDDRQVIKEELATAKK